MQVYLIVWFEWQGLIDHFGRHPRRLQLLFLSQGFSNGALQPPLEATELFSGGHE